MRKPRKLKKAIKGVKLLYDLAGLPKNYTLEKMESLFRNYGIIVWASDARFNISGRNMEFQPKLFPSSRKIKIVDKKE